MAFNISGLIGAGAQAGLDDLLRRQIVQQQIEQRMKEFEAEQGNRQQQMDLQRRQIGSIDRDREERRQAQQSALKMAQEQAERESLARSNMAELIDDPQQLAAFSLASGVDVPAGVRELSQPKKVNLTKVRTIGPDGKPVTRGVTDEELAAGIPEYIEPKAPAQVSRTWVLRDGKPVRVAESEIQPGDAPYTSARDSLRNVTAGDASRFAELQSSLDDLGVVRQTLQGTKDATGAMAGLQAALPNVVTEMTGIGRDAKSRVAVINRVKQVIGKALEGGVLRKEDEAKYEKILPTINDDPAVVETKLNGLESAIKLKLERELEAREASGFDVSGFRNGSTPPAGGGAPAALRWNPRTRKLEPVQE